MIDCKKCALLVMDFQAGFVDSIPKSDELLARVATAISTVRERDIQVVFVRMAFEDVDFVAIPDTNKMLAGVATSRPIHNNDAETAIHERLVPRHGDIVVRKIRVGAFAFTDLDYQLRQRGSDNLILAGIATSGVVLSTIRDAADRDYRLYVLPDGTADRDPDVHDFLMQKIFPRQAYVITTEDLTHLLSTGH